jgi:hypothetical protein
MQVQFVNKSPCLVMVDETGLQDKSKSRMRTWQGCGHANNTQYFYYCSTSSPMESTLPARVRWHAALHMRNGDPSVIGIRSNIARTPIDVVTVIALARTAAAVLARVQQATRPGAALSHARAHGARANAHNVAAAHNKRCDGDVREVERQQFTAWHVTAIIDARAQSVRAQCWILN